MDFARWLVFAGAANPCHLAQWWSSNKIFVGTNGRHIINIYLVLKSTKFYLFFVHLP